MAMATEKDLAPHEQLENILARRESVVVPLLDEANGRRRERLLGIEDMPLRVTDVPKGHSEGYLVIHGGTVPNSYKWAGFSTVALVRRYRGRLWLLVRVWRANKGGHGFGHLISGKWLNRAPQTVAELLTAGFVELPTLDKMLPEDLQVANDWREERGLRRV